MRTSDCISESSPGTYTIVRLEVPASYQYLSVITACADALIQHLGDLQDPQLLIYQIKLAIHETCANIIDHAYGRRGQASQEQAGEAIIARLLLLEQPRRIVVDLYDSGVEFDFSSVTQPDLDQPQTSGYGMFLIQQIMDEVLYEPLPGKNHWQLVKYL
jgi:serine/threonine-protein kinase RsbW